MDWLDLIILPLNSLLPVMQNPEANVVIQKVIQNPHLASAFGRKKTILGQEEGLFCFYITCIKLKSAKACKSDLFIVFWVNIWSVIWLVKGRITRTYQQKRKNVSCISKANNWEIEDFVWQPGFHNVSRESTIQSSQCLHTNSFSIIHP